MSTTNNYDPIIMIERYTIIFDPGVSRKEQEKMLFEPGETQAEVPDHKTMKAMIKFIGNFEDVKKIAAYLKELSSLAS